MEGVRRKEKKMDCNWKLRDIRCQVPLNLARRYIVG